MTSDVTHSHDPDALAALLVGRRIVGAGGKGGAPAHGLLLDDGTVLDVEANPGCGGGGCTSGSFDLTRLAAFPSRIMRVELERDEVTHRDFLGRDTSLDRYRLFVYSAAGPGRAVVTVEGTDGAPEYGTGFELAVRRAAHQQA